MTKQLWINLPVKNVQRSKDFFKQLGFSFNTKRDTPDSTCMLVGEHNLVIMLFSEAMFGSFTQHKITDTTQSSEVLFSFDAESRLEVDELADKVVKAGGKLFGKPSDVGGWMYGCGFTDLDGHRWNILYMDMSKMPK
jgi:uncharacterized protein